MKIIKTFKNNELLTFTEDNYQNLIKIYIDDIYDRISIKKGHKMNLIDRNKGSYKGSFMNNYICKKFRFNQKLNLTNIETNKILNYCKYFLLSDNEYVKYFPKTIKYKYQYFWFLRSPAYYDISFFTIVDNYGNANYHLAAHSLGFVPFFYKKED